MNCHNIRVFWGPYTPLTAPKSILIAQGVVAYPYVAWRGAQGFMWGTRGPFLPAAVMVSYGCVGYVGLWRLTSNWPNVGIVKIVYGSVYLEEPIRLPSPHRINFSVNPSVSPSICPEYENMSILNVGIKIRVSIGFFCPSSIPSKYLFLCARRKFRFNKKICRNLLIVLPT
jgi:hypothetical protein